jgi:hypothetical protein
MRPTPLLAALCLAACGAPPSSLTGTEPGDTAEPLTTTTQPGTTPSTPVAACSSGPLELEVGNGDVSHIQLSPGDPVMMVNGPQQGWHIDVSGYLSGISELVQIETTVTVADDAQVIGGSDQLPVRTALVGWSEGDCAGSFYGVRVFVDGLESQAPDAICPYAGVPLEVTVTVSDLMNPTRWVESTIEVIGMLDPRDVEVCGG